MYENVTFEIIMKLMLAKVPNTVDKREGSIIYDALAPAAIELQNMYIELDNILRETFGDTASREYLILRASERGVTPHSATSAVLKAVATPSTADIPIGSRFSLNELNYIVKDYVYSEDGETRIEGEYQVTCETSGIIGNSYFGIMTPINYIQGLQTLEAMEILIPGEDEEETESIRERYFETFETEAFGGNKKDYIQKTNDLDGVGSTKVTPVWNGGGTVLLTILDSEFNQATPTLVQTVQNEIDPTKDGSGIGIAPIGHIVTVRTVDNVPINITTSIVFREGYSFSGQKSKIEEAMEEYFREIRENWADEISSSVVISQINARILNLEGVLDISGTTINGNASNLALTAYQVPILGGVTNA